MTPNQPKLKINVNLLSALRVYYKACPKAAEMLQTLRKNTQEPAASLSFIGIPT